LIAEKGISQIDRSMVQEKPRAIKSFNVLSVELSMQRKARRTQQIKNLQLAIPKVGKRKISFVLFLQKDLS
jgi:hypothetical protein